MSTARRPPLQVLLPAALIGAGVAVLLLIPQNVDEPITWLASPALLGDAALSGTPLWWALQHTANVVLFVPVGVALGRVVRAPLAIVIGSALSAVCEVVQWWMPGREGSLLDVLMNSVGTVLGVLLVVAWMRRRAAVRKRAS